MLNIIQTIINPTLNTTINILLIIIGAYIVFKIIKKIINHFWKRYNLDFAGYYLVIDILKIIIGLVGATWILNEIGINLQGIFISVGIIGIIIGFAAKDTFSNLMSGIILLSDKTIKTGEVIEIKGLKGKITKVNLRAVTIKTEDDFKVTIPNSVLSNTPYTVYNNLELNKVKINICLPPTISISEFEEKLKEKLKEYPWIVKNKTPHIEDVNITKYGSEIKFYFWVEEYLKINRYKLIVGEEANNIISEFLKNQIKLINNSIN